MLARAIVRVAASAEGGVLSGTMWRETRGDHRQLPHDGGQEEDARYDADGTCGVGHGGCIQLPILKQWLASSTAML